jgi:hypothetical protein
MVGGRSIATFNFQTAIEGWRPIAAAIHAMDQDAFASAACAAANRAMGTRNGEQLT